MRKATLAALVLLLGACECGGEKQPLSPLVPLLSPDAARVGLPDVYVGASKEGVVRFHSSGTGVVHVHDVTLEEATAEGFSLVDTGAESLNPGATLEVRVAYAPAREGPASVVILVKSDADNAPTRVVLEANGLAPLDCEPSTTCRRWSFDPWAGACVSEDLDGPCDDENACTEDDTCFQGTCVGQAVTCPSPFSCTQGLCDATSGCVLLAHDDRCEDDDNPCTLERCDLEQGCVSETLMDGTPCGPTPSCASAALCYDGACTVFDVPDGTPCNDGDFCTVDDECFQGECGGTRVERTPAIAGEVRVFGSEGGRAALLSGGRILFLDPHTSGSLAAAGLDFPGAFGGYVATVVAVNDDGMQVLAQTDFPEERLPLRVIESSPGVVIGFHTEEGVQRVQRFEIAPDGGVALLATAEVPERLGYRAITLPDGRLVVQGTENKLWLVDPSDLSQTLLAQLPTYIGSLGRDIVGIASFSGAVMVALNFELFLVGLDGNVTLFAEELGRVRHIASDGDLLAAATCASNPGGACRVLLFDFSYDELASIPVDQGSSHLVALEGDRLIVGRDGPAVAYDVSAPSAPVTLSQTLPWSAAGVDDIALQAGLVLFTEGTWSSDTMAPPVVARLGDAGLRFVTHPRWGSPGTLRSQGNRLLAASMTSVHHLDVNAAGAPLVLAGAPLARPVGHFGLRTLPLVLSNGVALMPKDGGYRDDYSVPVYEVSVPALPPFPLRILTVPGIGSLASNRRFLAALDRSGGAGQEALLLFDLLSLPPDEEMSFAPLSTTPIPWGLEDVPSNRSLRIAMDDDNQIAVLSSRTMEETAHRELLLFDATNPEAPALLGRTELSVELPSSGSSTALDLAIAGPSVAMLERSMSTVRVVRRLTDGTLVQTMLFDTGAQQRLLRFDGRTIVLGGFWNGEISFWDVSGAAPLDLGTLQLPDEAIAVEPFADTLVVNGQSSVVTLDPPCPPLP